MVKPIQIIEYGDLVGRLEIAERARVSSKTVDTWRKRHPGFPEPIGVISGTPLWLWPAVEEWLRDTPRDAGRPRTRQVSIPAISPLPERLRRAIRTTPDESKDEDDPLERATSSAG